MHSLLLASMSQGLRETPSLVKPKYHVSPSGLTTILIWCVFAQLPNHLSSDGLAQLLSHIRKKRLFFHIQGHMVERTKQTP